MRLSVAIIVIFGTRLVAADRSVIYGVIEDATGQALAGADVGIQSESTGARWKTTSDNEGSYSVAALPAGEYKVTVRLPGFQTVSKVGTVLEAGQELQLDFAMKLPTLHQVITVVGEREDLDPSGGDSLLMTRDGEGSALPANGPDSRLAFDLLPGIVITPAGTSDGGQFTANGQRPNAHAFEVDGVSANSGVGGSALPGSFPGASLPAMSAGGSTEELGSSADTQSVELRTSSFAPESGGRTGAQAQVTTRSGSNEFHGEVVGNVRDSDWSARDWFANSYALACPRPEYGDVDAALGGRIRRNWTYFFLSIGHSEIHETGLELTPVPSPATRQDASPQLQAILSSFPSPIGPNLGGGEAEGLMELGRATTVGTYSGRIDQALRSQAALFVRYARSISASSSSQVEAIQGDSDWESTTVGIIVGRPARAIQEIRFNYSDANFFSRSNQENWSLWQLANLPTPSWESSYPVSALSIPDLGQFLFGDAGMTARQDQWEFRDTVSTEIRNHQMRFGLDYVRLQPARNLSLTSILAETSSLESLLQGEPLNVTMSQLPQHGSRVHIGSLFAQDTYRVTGNLNLVYGFRWELTPPIDAQAQNPGISGLWSGMEWIAENTGFRATAPWPTRYAQFEPRIGLAYRSPSSGLVLRAGAGLFYDTALGASINPINGVPFNSWLLPGGSLTASAPSAAPAGTQTSPAQATTPDVEQFLAGPYPALHLPASYQWRTSLERALGTHSAGSVAYVGTANRNLLGNESYTDPATGVLERSVSLTQNSSTYQGLQSQLRGSLRPNLYVSSSFTWSHCIDTGSEDSSIFLIHPGYQLNEARGACDFDVRRILTSSVSYRMPRGEVVRLPGFLSGWNISGIFRARTGFPINILDNEQLLGDDAVNAARPDIVAGVPVWITDPGMAGGRRLNPAAFSLPPNGNQGNLGRNAIYGNGMIQLDAGLHRALQSFRGTSLEIGFNVYNVLNHPAFSDPVPFLSSPLFGQSPAMQNLMLGSGTPNTGVTSLFQTGGPRSAQFSIRFSF